jgi:DNA polymerase-3 subunit gamma/tau
MFENVIHQSAVTDISQSLTQDSLPNSLLFFGEKTSGKLTAALELARVLSCEKRVLAVNDGSAAQCRWDCSCASCLRHKQLASQDVLLAGSRDCLSEIEAAQKTFLTAFESRAPYIQASCYLFVRSVRKLTLRFSPAVVQNEEAQKIQKIASLVSDIEQLVEDIEPSSFITRFLSEPPGALKKLTQSIIDLCKKLDSDFMYAALPISYVRAISSWARFAVKTGKKTVVIENAETLNEHARNAFLKILEEPPEGIVFVLTTVRRQMMMPTILSRVRAYRFEQRARDKQIDVLKRVFHLEEKDVLLSHNAIEAYLNSFLPVQPDSVRHLGNDFLYTLLEGGSPDSKKIAAQANGFQPAQLLNAFFDGMIHALKEIARIQNNGVQTTAGESAKTSEIPAEQNRHETERAVNFCVKCMELVNAAKARITFTNQNPTAALDALKCEIAGLA